jgi:hypothetical protein
MARASKFKGGDMHKTGAVKLDPNESGVNVLPDGKIAVTEQVVEALIKAYEARKGAK